MADLNRISGPLPGVLDLAEIPQDAEGAFRYLLLSLICEGHTELNYQPSNRGV